MSSILSTGSEQMVNYQPMSQQNTRGLWARAAQLADQTPADRNRYVDLLRALAIGSVVLGHWIMAAPYYDGVAQMDHLLAIQPWSRWLTWIFQVMPVFFFVGGFSNGVSWDSAQRKNLPYNQWLEARMRRLLGPAIPLVLLWVFLAAVGNHTGVHPQMIKVGSQVSLVPVWFLAIYFVIVLLVPLTRAAWNRFGYWSVSIPLLLAVFGDWMFFNSSLQWLGWFNYLFIWGAVHQLGYAWQQQKLGGATQSLILAIVSMIILIALTQYGPYPTSLVGVPGETVSNTTPPKLPLVALGLTQIGLLLSLEKPMRRWLSRGRVWTATVLTNGFIMPIFLWHSTVMILMIGLTFLVWPTAFNASPGSEFWWALRPVWIAVYFSVLLLGLPLFVKLEKVVATGSHRNTPLSVLAIAGLMICGGLALLAKSGVTGAGPLGISWLAVGLPLAGAALITLAGKRVSDQ
jgi:hypothetical protein